MSILQKIRMAAVCAVPFLSAGCMDTANLDDPLGSLQTVSYNHWDVRGRFTTRDLIVQNVTREDLVTLLSGKTFVGYEESDGRGAAYGALSVSFYNADGSLPMCILNYMTGKPRDDAFGTKHWASVHYVLERLGVSVPVMRIQNLDSSFGYLAILYQATSGKIAGVGGFGRTSEDVRKGHLQNGIPAAVYTACPDFPSAESLGTFVNHNQTSWNYFELVEQDAGDRVIRPDLVTEFTPVPLNPAVTP
jgi:hypothetical protein